MLTFPPFKGLKSALSEEDGTAIFNNVKGLAPAIKQGFDTLVQKKGVFAASGYSGNVKQALALMNTQSDDFVSALTDKAPNVSHCSVLQSVKNECRRQIIV